MRTYLIALYATASTAIDAFGVIKTSQELLLINGLLTFDTVVRNADSGFDAASSSFIVPVRSLYWMSIAVEVPTHTAARVRVSNTSLVISKTFLESSDVDILSRSGVVQVEAETKVLMLFDVFSKANRNIKLLWVCMLNLAQPPVDAEAVLKFTIFTLCL